MTEFEFQGGVRLAEQLLTLCLGTVNRVKYFFLGDRIEFNCRGTRNESVLDSDEPAQCVFVVGAISGKRNGD